MELNSKESRHFRLFHFYHVFRAFAGPNEKNIASSWEFIPIQFHTVYPGKIGQVCRKYGKINEVAKKGLRSTFCFQLWDSGNVLGTNLNYPSLKLAQKMIVSGLTSYSYF